MRAILLKVKDPISYTVTADRQKSNRFIKQNYKFSRASRFFVHKKRRENSQAVHALKNNHPSQNRLSFHCDLSYH